jgi:putative membrane protein
MSAEDRTEKAEDRTDLAEDRTVLAHERTFAGWLRTGMAAVGVGLGFNALFGDLEPMWIPKGIATAFLLTAIFIFLSAERRARGTIGRLEPHQISAMKPVRLALLAWVMTGATSTLILAIWAMVD